MNSKDSSANNEPLLSRALLVVLHRNGLQCGKEAQLDFIKAPDTAQLAEQFLAQLEAALRSRLDAAATSPSVSSAATTSAPEALLLEPVLPTGELSEVNSTVGDSGARHVNDKDTPLAHEPEEGVIPVANTVAELQPEATEPQTLVEATSTPTEAASSKPESVVLTQPPPVTTMSTSITSPKRAYPSISFQLHNAKQGQEFDGRPMPSPSVSVTISEVTFPEEIDLKLEKAGQRIIGTPTKAGDFQLEIEHYFNDDPERIPRIAKSLLTVIADPRTLWQNHPSDENNNPFWKPDHDSRQLETDGARLVAASLRGRSHAHKGTCRDDDFFIGTSNGWRIAVVADGAGSAKFSRRGAQLAAETAGKFMADELIKNSDLLTAAENMDGSDATQDILKKAIYKVVGYAAHSAMKALSDEVKQASNGVHPFVLADLNTTLLIAIARPVGNRMVVGTYTIGDGAVGILCGSDTVTLGGVPDGGEFSGGTRFLAPQYVEQDELWKRTHAFVLDEVKVIVLVTDGVSDAKFKSDSALEKRSAWDALMLEIADAATFDIKSDGLSDGLDKRLLEWLNFWVPGEHDDRTIAIIW